MAKWKVYWKIFKININENVMIFFRENVVSRKHHFYAQKCTKGYI